MSNILFFLTCKDTTGIELALEHDNESDQMSICLLQDAVYHANKSNSLIQEFIKKGKIYAVKEDVEKRGIESNINNDVKLLDYSEIIDLVIANDNLINL